MKTRNIVLAFVAFFSLVGVNMNAQEVNTSNVTCKDYYYQSCRDNWYMQFGVGAQTFFADHGTADGQKTNHYTMAFDFAVGKWLSPYTGFRINVIGGSLHWSTPQLDYLTSTRGTNGDFSSMRYVSLSADFMWDMFNSLGGVNTKRFFSIVPFVGLGGTYGWNNSTQFANPNFNGVMTPAGDSWMLPVNAGLNFRFRLCDYVDFNIEARGQFYGDNFNKIDNHASIESVVSAIGGFTIHFSPYSFKTYNPCTYLAYINDLNGQVNKLRSELANCEEIVRTKSNCDPCPEAAPAPKAEVVQGAPLMSAVRFAINSSKVSSKEMINVYQMAEWLKQNPDAKVIVAGYADKGTGTSNYNMKLSQKRADNVAKILVDKYGINADRLTAKGFGSADQPFSENNWNRIVLFRAD